MFTDFTEEQTELRNTVRRFLSEHSSEDQVRSQMETERGYDPKVWNALASQLGVHGLAIPEEYGGHGFGWVELGIVLEEMGRSLLCAPFFASIVLAANAILESGDEEAKQRLLPGIADGSTIATLVTLDSIGPRSQAGADAGVGITATQSGDTWHLDGTAAMVLDGHVANLVIVPAQTEHGLTLFSVEAGTSGFAAALRGTLDQTRKMADHTFDGVQATVLGEVGGATPVLDRTRDLAVIGLALEQVGASEAALEMSVEYLKTRVQFGQPIGAFQALKHMAADVLVDVETARSTAYYAMSAAADGSDEVPAAAALAAAYCTDAFVSTAHQNIQFHGGMGFTWELPAHLYFKRSRSSQLLLGEPEAHRERLAQLIGL